jgi:hypothetical protein
MIWARLPSIVALLEAWTNGIPIDSVGGSAQEPVNLEDTEKRDAPPSPNRQVPQFAVNSSQGSKTPPTPRSAACKKPWVTVSLHKNLF